MEPIVNRVANSPLVTLDIEEHIDHQDPSTLDLKYWLFQEIILKEKEFRQFVKDHNWSQYEGKNVLITCSSEAIIPSWAYMLIVSRLQPYASTIAVGSVEDLEKSLIDKAIEKLNWEDFRDKKLVIKGCGSLQARDYAYVQVTKRLVPIASSIMYGEPCSTVPVYKKPRN